MHIWPAYPNSLEYFKYFSGCIVCISSGSLNLIWFIFDHVILYFCNSCLCLYALVGEIKFIYLFILFYCVPHIRKLCSSHAVILWNDLDDPVIDGVGLAGLKSWEYTCFIDGIIFSISFFFSTIFRFLPSLGWLRGYGIFGLIVF